MKAAVEERRSRLRRGLRSETLAALALRLKGYRILARRYRTGAGEIDLIALRGRRLAFIEVKRRQSFSEAETAIAPRQQARVRRAADLWLARNGTFRDREIVFDVVFLVPGRWPRHIENGL